MAEVKGYVFDIEGTLYKGGELQKGVPELFRTISNTGKPIMFVSGMNRTEMQQVVDKISDEAGVKLNSILASNAGASICYNGEKTSSTLNPEKINQIRDIVRENANGSVVVFRTDITNYREKAIEADTISAKAKKGITIFLKAILEAMKKVELNCIPTSNENLSKLIDSNEICSLEICALPSNIKPLALKIREVLPELKITESATVQISTKSKWSALQDVFGEDAKDVCYFGDSDNDIECIQNCQKAVLTNAKKSRMFDVVEKEQSKGNEKFATVDLGDAELHKYILGNSYSSEYLNNMTTSAKGQTKDAKASKSLTTR